MGGSACELLAVLAATGRRDGGRRSRALGRAATLSPLARWSREHSFAGQLDHFRPTLAPLLVFSDLPPSPLIRYACRVAPLQAASILTRGGKQRHGRQRRGRQRGVSHCHRRHCHRRHSRRRHSRRRQACCWSARAQGAPSLFMTYGDSPMGQSRVGRHPPSRRCPPRWSLLVGLGQLRMLMRKRWVERLHF